MAVIIPIKKTVDLKDGLNVQSLTIQFVQGDGPAHRLDVALLDSGQPVSLDGKSVLGKFLRADGATVIIQGQATGNAASILFDSACYAVVGRLMITVSIDMTSVLQLDANVRVGMIGAVIDPGHKVPSMDELLGEVDNMRTATAETEAITVLATEAVEEAQNMVTVATDAVKKTQEATKEATEAAADTREATKSANAAAAKIDGMTMDATEIAEGGKPTATITDVDGHMQVELGLVTGKTGAQGPGYTIKGEAYATLDALVAAVPSPAEGDQYNVGTTPPYHTYRWTGIDWEDEGILQGPSGADAPPTVYVGDLTPTYPGIVVHVDTSVEDAPLTGADIPVSATDDTRLDVAIAQAVRQTLLAAYPVGAIYMSVAEADPSGLFGGTWTPWGAGRVPVGVDATQPDFNAVGKMGGAKTHILSGTEMPAHIHTLYNSPGAGTPFPAYAAKDNGFVDASPTTGNGSNTSFAGGGLPHNNLQPYITCYMWRRIG